MKILISALLCLFIVGCSPTPNSTTPMPAASAESETTVPIATNAPKKTISYSDLNNFTFVIDIGDDTVHIAGDNMQGKRSQLHIAMTGYDSVAELNTKGGSKLFERSSPDEEYVESELEYSDVDFDGLYTMLYQVGVDFQGCYKDAKFTLVSEDTEFYIYNMEFEGDVYEVTVDKATGIWTKLRCDGKTLLRVIEFSLEKGVIPNH